MSESRLRQRAERSLVSAGDAAPDALAILRAGEVVVRIVFIAHAAGIFVSDAAPESGAILDARGNPSTATGAQAAEVSGGGPAPFTMTIHGAWELSGIARNAGTTIVGVGRATEVAVTIFTTGG